MTQFSYNNSRPKDALNAWLSFVCPRSDVRAAKCQHCQTEQGMGLKYNSKQLFFFSFFGKSAIFLYAATLSKSSTHRFPNRNTWRGIAQLFALPGVILNSSRVWRGSWLRYVQCNRLVSSSLRSEWLFNLHPMKKKSGHARPPRWAF